LTLSEHALAAASSETVSHARARVADWRGLVFIVG
jgi:hypothetical protein